MLITATNPKELTELARSENKSPISYSQFSLYATCPFAWKSKYIDKIKDDSYSIHLLFGSAMHTVLQEYLTTFYKKGGTVADTINFDKRLLEEMSAEFQNAIKDLPTEKLEFTSQREMIDFYRQGLETLYFLRKNRGDYFQKKDWELVGIEVPIFAETDANKNVIIIGFLDVVLKNTKTRKYKIIDFKTSTRGWTAKDKSNILKSAQLILYKKYYAKQYGIDANLIDIEFIILRRMIFEESEFPQKRIQRHAPASGKPSINKVEKLFSEFVGIFDITGNAKSDTVYIKNASPSTCKYCYYGETKICDKNKKK